MQLLQTIYSIPNFAKIANPLTKLFRFDQPWMLEAEQERAFEAVKEALTSAEMLASPNPTKPFYLDTFTIYRQMTKGHIDVSCKLTVEGPKNVGPFAGIQNQISS